MNSEDILCTDLVNLAQYIQKASTDLVNLASYVHEASCYEAKSGANRTQIKKRCEGRAFCMG